MGKKTETPVCDFLEELLSGGTSAELALKLAREQERRITADTRAMAEDVEILNRRRAYDRKRKSKREQKSTGTSTGMSAEGVFQLSSLGSIDSNLSKGRKSGKTHSGGSSTGRPMKGIPLPDDWAPSEGHYREAQLAGCPRSVVDKAVLAMRRWAVAEGHRSIARKDDRTGWDACFAGTWLRKEIEVHKRNNTGAGARGTSFVETVLRTSHVEKPAREVVAGAGAHVARIGR